MRIKQNLQDMSIKLDSETTEIYIYYRGFGVGNITVSQDKLNRVYIKMIGDKSG